MPQDRWSSFSAGRVNPLAPATVAAAGLVIFLVGPRWTGAGVVVGAGLATINGLLLSRRIDLAAATGDITRAMLVMQLGLVTTFVLIGLVTVVLVKLSLALAVAAAAGFGVTQLAMLAVFYWKHGRGEALKEKVS